MTLYGGFESHLADWKKKRWNLGFKNRKCFFIVSPHVLWLTSRTLVPLIRIKEEKCLSVCLYIYIYIYTHTHTHIISRCVCVMHVYTAEVLVSVSSPKNR